MEAHVLSKNSQSTWYMFGRDSNKSEGIIDTNQYMIRTKKSAFLMDPGGIELFSTMLAMVLRYTPADEIHHVFASHQDPDVISSLEYLLELSLAISSSISFMFSKATNEPSYLVLPTSNSEISF